MAAPEQPPPAGLAPRRVIAHLDVDAFYASVELLRRPELRGRPVVVAGTGPRSVVTTASYEARRFGIDSAMPAARARALCPHAVFLPPDFESYRAKSRDVWELVRERLQRLQQVGIDEAYADVTEVARPLGLLRELVADVRTQTGMTISVGVGPSRLVAKTVSASYKPAAFVALSREDACRRFAGAPVRILQGIGPKTADRLAALGVRTVGDLQALADDALVERFGTRMGAELKARSLFHDDSPVETVRVAKSRSAETTFPQDVADPRELEQTLVRLAESLCDHLRRREVRGRTVGIKVRLDDWTTVTRARTLPDRTNDTDTVTTIALDLLRAYAPARPVRLLGVRVAAFEDPPAAERSARATPSLQLALPV
jgi:DNA polymerase-4